MAAPSGQAEDAAPQAGTGPEPIEVATLPAPAASDPSARRGRRPARARGLGCRDCGDGGPAGARRAALSPRTGYRCRRRNRGPCRPLRSGRRRRPSPPRPRSGRRRRNPISLCRSSRRRRQARTHRRARPRPGCRSPSPSPQHLARAEPAAAPPEESAAAPDEPVQAAGRIWRYVQLGAADSRRPLEVHWEMLRRRHDDALVGLSPLIMPVDRDDGGITYRAAGRPPQRRGGGAAGLRSARGARARLLRSPRLRRP